MGCNVGMFRVGEFRAKPDEVEVDVDESRIFLGAAIGDTWGRSPTSNRSGKGTSDPTAQGTWTFLRIFPLVCFPIQSHYDIKL